MTIRTLMTMMIITKRKMVPIFRKWEIIKEIAMMRLSKKMLLSRTMRANRKPPSCRLSNVLKRINHHGAEPMSYQNRVL